ncbi:hypothetical protein BX600DRAFT_430690 [Xylariales sp. PMI_506]|nr:hypothetical protein BX600DRAFT_430690 [Xylariales sp. PMI_506]
MSGKLDQSLDEILSTQRKTGPRRGRPQRRSAGRPVTTAPVGGVQKSSKKPQAAATKQAPAKAAGGNGDSKIVVSNLPKDVTESQIKRLNGMARTGAFTQDMHANPAARASCSVPKDPLVIKIQSKNTLEDEHGIGAIKRVELSYGPGGTSRGIATVIFSKADGASKAFAKLNGLLVDGKPIKIEIIVGGNKAAEIAPPAKTLTERISQPKSQPKSAAPNKKKEIAAKEGAGAAGAARGRRKGRARSARPAKKTAEELDSEMADYFEAGNNQNNENVNSGAPAVASGGDAPMEDEILRGGWIEGGIRTGREEMTWRKHGRAISICYGLSAHSVLPMHFSVQISLNNMARLLVDQNTAHDFGKEDKLDSMVILLGSDSL